MNTWIAQKLNQLKLAAFSSVHFLYTYILKPHSKNEDDKRQEFILNVLLVSSILLYGTGFVLASYNKITNEAYNGADPLIIFILLIPFLILYYISRFKSYRFSSYSFILLFLIPLLHAAYYWGVDLPAVPLFTSLIIVMSSILIGTRFSFILTFIISTVFIFITNLQISGILNPDRTWKTENLESTMNDIVSYIVIFSIIAIISWLSNREIEKSLKRARNSEKELQKEKELLEIKVGERTKELQKVQMEKMKEISRLADFGRLSSGLFHDLINPLTALSFNIEKMKQSQDRRFKEIEEDLDRALKVTEKMRDFITSVKKQINFKEEKHLFSLNKEIEEVIQVLAYQTRKNDIEISFNASENIQIIGNPIKFNQIILNLASNSIDALDLDSQQKNINISLQKNDNSITIYVRDNGKGIPEEIKDKIFKDFFTTKKNGTGIGLHLVKDIIENDFEGEINFESDQNRGTTFTIKLKQII